MCRDYHNQSGSPPLCYLLPARKILFAPTQRHTILPGGKTTPFLGMLVHGVSFHRFKGPCSAAGLGWQTHLLYVDGEDRELRGSQPTYNTTVLQHHVFLS